MWIRYGGRTYRVITDPKPGTEFGHAVVTVTLLPQAEPGTRLHGAFMQQKRSTFREDYQFELVREVLKDVG